MALLSAISFYYFIEKFYNDIMNHIPSITTFKLNNEKQSGWDTNVDSSVTSSVKTYLDRNYSGWTLANSKQCFNDTQDPVQLYGDFDGDGTSDFAIREYIMEWNYIFLPSLLLEAFTC